VLFVGLPLLVEAGLFQLDSGGEDGAWERIVELD
jgi:hypothetical protein